jgi:Ca2+-binding RTX toxin-like protein
VIYANRGTDTSAGGDGNDVLWAMARADVAPGGVDQVGDTLDGGNGDDEFRTRDGEVDRITCGPGQDRARLDGVDVITDATAENPNGSCEQVQRKAPKGNESAPEDQQEAPKEPSPAV